MKQKVNSYKRYFWTCSQCDHFYFKPPEKIIFSQTNNTPRDFYLDFLLSKMIQHKHVSKPVNISGRITHKLHVLKMKDQDSSSGIKAQISKIYILELIHAISILQKILIFDYLFKFSAFSFCFSFKPHFCCNLKNYLYNKE